MPNSWNEIIEGNRGRAACLVQVKDGLGPHSRLTVCCPGSWYLAM